MLVIKSEWFESQVYLNDVAIMNTVVLASKMLFNTSRELMEAEDDNAISIDDFTSALFQVSRIP